MGFDFGRAFDFTQTAVTDPGSLLTAGAERRAAKQIRRAKASQAIKAERFDVLEEDASPLRRLRNENLSRLLQLQGIGGPVDRGEFLRSPEFTSVRDAALRVGAGGVEGLQGELTERADQLGFGTFDAFQNRLLNQTQLGAGGLQGTNRLLQTNVDEQVNILNQGGTQAAESILANQARTSGAITGLAKAGAAIFCDARLKDNTELIGQYDCGIGKYTWDWTEEAKEFVGDQPSTGPMAHEVYKLMPDNVSTQDGVLTVKDMERIH